MYPDKIHLISVLNWTNAEDEETVLHILSRRDTMMNLIEYLLCLGVDLSVANACGDTAVEIAWRFSMPIYNFYKLAATPLPPVPAVTSSSFMTMTVVEDEREIHQYKKKRMSDLLLKFW